MTCFYTLESSEFSCKKTQTFTHLNSRTQSSYSFTCSLPCEEDFPANRCPPSPSISNFIRHKFLSKPSLGTEHCNLPLQTTNPKHVRKNSQGQEHIVPATETSPMLIRRACYVLLSTMLIPPAQSCSRTNPQRHHLRKQISCIYYFKAVMNGSYVTQVLVLW